jgi:hypothetical protein
LKSVWKNCHSERSEESALGDRPGESKKQILRRCTPQNDRLGLPEAASYLVVVDACLVTRSDTGSWLSGNQLSIAKADVVPLTLALSQGARGYMLFAYSQEATDNGAIRVL